MNANVIPLPIPVRRMDFQFGSIPKYWYRGNSWITHYLNAMSAVFPDGERFFMHSVRLFEKQVSDPALRAQIRNFIGQEANHGKEHEGFNRALEMQHGFRIGSLMKASLEGIEVVKKKFPKRLQLAMTVGFEHFTAIMAHQFLSNPEYLKGVDEAQMKIFLWHAVEETEHKAVAFDVYKQVDGSYPLRIAGMLISSTLFFVVVPKFAWHLIKKDGQAGNWQDALGLLNFLFGQPGFYRNILSDYLDFFKPGFHPWDHDNRSLVKALIQDLRRFEIAQRMTAGEH